MFFNLLMLTFSQSPSNPFLIFQHSLSDQLTDISLIQAFNNGIINYTQLHSKTYTIIMFLAPQLDSRSAKFLLRFNVLLLHSNHINKEGKFNSRTKTKERAFCSSTKDRASCSSWNRLSVWMNPNWSSPLFMSLESLLWIVTSVGKRLYYSDWLIC